MQVNITHLGHSLHSFWIYSHLTLLLNMFGDILTSMAKPLGDLEYIFCYYSTGFFHTSIPKCSVDSWLVPLLTIIPFWIRFMQCLSRVKKEGSEHRIIHLSNMGKYGVSMLVIITTNLNYWSATNLSPYARRLVFVLLYLVASLYSMTWDFVFDWGLVPDADNFLRYLFLQQIFIQSPKFDDVPRLDVLFDSNVELGRTTYVGIDSHANKTYK